MSVSFTEVCKGNQSDRYVYCKGELVRLLERMTVDGGKVELDAGSVGEVWTNQLYSDSLVPVEFTISLSKLCRLKIKASIPDKYLEYVTE